MFLEKFNYTLVYLDVCYAIWITGCFNYLSLCHFSPFLVFSQDSIFWHAGQNILKTVQAIHLKVSGVL